MKALNICISALLLLTLGSCNDFLKETPQSFLTTEGAIQDKAFVEAQLMGAYKSLLLYRNDRGGFLGISGTDEAVGKTVEVNYWPDQGAIDKYNATLNSENKLTKWYWDTSYFAISRANNTISACSRPIPDGTEEWIRSIESEARFIRALGYFHLAQYFGNAPIITEKTDVAVPNYPREEVSKIYALILEDLAFAEQHIKTAYGSGRATWGAIKALQVKTYIYAQEESGFRDLKKAKGIIEEIESANIYTLMPSYEDLFKEEFENNSESVYEFQFKYPEEPNNFQYYCGSRAIGYNSLGGGYGIFLPSAYYLNSFEETDTRLDASVRFRYYYDGKDITETWSGDPEYVAPHCKKYEDPTTPTDPGNSAKNIYFMRYADLVLLYAECLNETGETAKAIEQVNRVRSRANASLVTTMAQDKLRDFIYEERMRELGMEGWRRLDLTRRSKSFFASQVSKYNHFATESVQEYHALFPIPKNEINMNEGIGEADQNPGYN